MMTRMRGRCGGLAMLAAVALIWLATVSPDSVSVAADKKANSVELVIDYGDGAQLRFAALAWQDGMTVVDVLEAAQKHSHGISFARRGKGASTLITQIGDLKNQGDGKNWLFSVNGMAGQVGAGAYELKPLDVVLWEFKVYE